MDLGVGLLLLVICLVFVVLGLGAVRVLFPAQDAPEDREPDPAGEGRGGW